MHTSLVHTSLVKQSQPVNSVSSATGHEQVYIKRCDETEFQIFLHACFGNFIKYNVQCTPLTLYVHEVQDLLAGRNNRITA
jgi:hypothetical protein